VQQFEPTDEFPASTRLSVHCVDDPDANVVRVVFDVQLIPALMPYAREGVLELSLEEGETEKLKAFLDDRFCLFASEYLRIRDADSPYQQDRKVTDPVCGMTFHPTEAASTVVHDGKTYYFCVEACRETFEAQPARFLPNET
jgi:YHS domain-containing protein